MSENVNTPADEAPAPQAAGTGLVAPDGSITLPNGKVLTKEQLAQVERSFAHGFANGFITASETILPFVAVLGTAQGISVPQMILALLASAALLDHDLMEGKNITPEQRDLLNEGFSQAAKAATKMAVQVAPKLNARRDAVIQEALDEAGVNLDELRPRIDKSKLN
jgi:hypothetical protein